MSVLKPLRLLWLLREGVKKLGLVMVIGLTACSPRFSPWDIKLDADQRHLTEKHLAWLATREPAELPITFAILGDPQGTPSDFRQAIQSINQLDDVHFTLVLGDMTDFGLKHEYEWAAEAIAESQIPVLTVIGNHDAISHGKKIYQSMFGPFNYQFTYAGLKFLMWNNNLFEFGETNFDWLRAHADQNTVVASHIPPVVDMHSERQLNEWWDINRNAEIITSLHGHRGGKRDFYWQKEEVPYYVVARTRGVRFTLVTINQDYEVSFQYCQASCPTTE
jgi:hypothetical protein